VIIGHLSDLHVVEAGQRLFGVIDTQTATADAVRHLSGLNPRPDAVIVTGDLTGHGQAAEYAAARDLLDALPVPYYVIPGNHDRRARLLDVFAGHAWAAPGGVIQYTVDDFPVRLVAVDSVDEGHDEGRLSPDRLAWLDATLAGEPERPTLVYLHHPPVRTGVWWMDTAGLAGATEFAAVLERHPQVGLVACGHIHRAIGASVGRARVAVAPSPAFAVHLDLEPGRPPRAAWEPGACLVHTYRDRQFVTHTLLTAQVQPPVDLAGDFGDWPTVRARWEQRLRRISEPLPSGPFGSFFVISS
jgi:3',5'-cyclic AMP phosphodiesterase CpdA